jgi:hypothetical protein
MTTYLTVSSFHPFEEEMTEYMRNNLPEELKITALATAGIENIYAPVIGPWEYPPTLMEYIRMVCMDPDGAIPVHSVYEYVIGGVHAGDVVYYLSTCGPWHLEMDAIMATAKQDTVNTFSLYRFTVPGDEQPVRNEDIWQDFLEYIGVPADIIESMDQSIVKFLNENESDRVIGYLLEGVSAEQSLKKNLKVIEMAYDALMTNVSIATKYELILSILGQKLTALKTDLEIKHNLSVHNWDKASGQPKDPSQPHNPGTNEDTRSAIKSSLFGAEIDLIKSVEESILSIRNQQARVTLEVQLSKMDVERLKVSQNMIDIQERNE